MQSIQLPHTSRTPVYVTPQKGVSEATLLQMPQVQKLRREPRVHDQGHSSDMAALSYDSSQSDLTKLEQRKGILGRPSRHWHKQNRGPQYLAWVSDGAGLREALWNASFQKHCQIHGVVGDIPAGFNQLWSELCSRRRSGWQYSSLCMYLGHPPLSV